MARKSDVPEGLEIWTGGPRGLRLRKHPRLVEALAYLGEYPMVIRKPVVLEASRLPRGASPVLTLGSLPVFVRSSVGEATTLRLELDIPALDVVRPEQFARIFIETADALLEEHLVVRVGKRQALCLPFPAFESETVFTVRMELRQCGAAGKVEQAFQLKPEKRLTFYYTFQTHLDLGWTDRVVPVVASLKQMTRKTAIDVCRRFMDRPEGERFIWTCECSDALRLAWEGASAVEQEGLRELVRKGLIQCCALPFSFHTGLMSHDLLTRAIARSVALRHEMGLDGVLDLSVAQNNDVPGHSWILPDILGEAGIHRAVIGHNHMVRGCQLPPLFNMRGPGGHSVLTLATSCVDYGTEFPVPQRPDEFFALSANNPNASPMPGTAYLRRIGYGENCGPEGAQREIDAIAAWNRKYAWPHLVIGACQDYFEHIEQEVNLSALPVVDQEISDWWIDGPASTPRAMATYRRVMVQRPALESLVPAGATEDRRLLATIEENLILHAEHTFGMNAQLVKVTAAAQDWSLRGLDTYKGSWEDKEVYASRARQAADDLIARYPLPKPVPLAHPRDWTIDGDARGIRGLVDPDGATWYVREESGAAPPFGTVTQRLLDTELDEWFHHNPPAADAPGDYAMTLHGVTAAGETNGVLLSGSLDSPAGAIAGVTVEICNDPRSEDLLVRVQLRGKAATAQAELLTLALPFTVAQPAFDVDVGGALLRVDDDQRPDANRDEHPAIAGWLLRHTSAGRSLAVSSAEVFLWHFGGLRYCDWGRTTSPRTSSVYAHLFNNVWNTNFRCWLEGDLDYTIRIRRADGGGLEALQEMTGRWGDSK
ncbi:MAG: hypothetical protein HQ523_05540 [Lentisphaerae bacterium]|nr:hypothetical protein [Lentisphaerota bacterium]